MITVIKDQLFRPAAFLLAAILLSGCATKERPGRESDCARARARYAEIKRSLGAYYAAGTTSSAQIAIAERRLRKAKEDYVSACGRNTTRRPN